MIHYSNIKGGPKTTAIGIVVLLVSVIGFFAMEDVGMSEFIMGIVAGAAFLGIKDPRKA